MNSSLVSIVLPTYNGAQYISQSIESCLKQTYVHFELIIVNDCSTDMTPEIIARYASLDSRISIINNTINKKLPQSLNKGFNKATGKYFTWTSDDNFYAPEALEKLVNVLDHNSTIDLVYTDYTLIDENSSITGVRNFGDVNRSFNNWLGCGACFLYKSEIHSSINGYNPAAFLIEDYDFFVRAFTRFHFFYLADAALYYYREHAASLTATQKNVINDISKIFLERNLTGLEKKLKQDEIILLYRKFAVHYAVTKNNTTVYKDYLKKMMPVSVKQTLYTVSYVLIIKSWFALRLGSAGIFYFLKVLIAGKEKSI